MTGYESLGCVLSQPMDCVYDIYNCLDSYRIEQLVTKIMRRERRSNYM